MSTIGVILVIILFIVSNFTSLILGFVAGERNGIKITEKNKLNNNRNVDFSKCINKIDNCVRANEELDKMIERLIKLSKKNNVK